MNLWSVTVAVLACGALFVVFSGAAIYWLLTGHVADAVVSVLIGAGMVLLAERTERSLDA